MKFDRPEFESSPAGMVQGPTPAQLVLMHRSFLQQAAQARRDGEVNDAARWDRLAERLREATAA